MEGKAKEYHILGVRVYIYRRVLDEIGFPNDDNKRYHFSTGVGKFPTDKIVIKDEFTLKDILGEDYRKRPNGYMFVTESVKDRLKEKYELELSK